MDAMAGQSANGKLNQLWQMPLLLASLGLFGYAAYLFIDPRPGLTIDQKIEIARVYMKQERPEAALEQLNKLLNTEKLDAEHEGAIHLALAQSLELAQRQKKINVPVNHQRIIEQTRLAMGLGVRADADVHRRLAESFEALDRPGEALPEYRQAQALDVNHALHLQRKIVDLQVAQHETAAAGNSLSEYLATKEITDSERSWAMGEQAQMLAEGGKYAEAKALLADAGKLDVDSVSQGALNYRMGYCEWKVGNLEEAERYLRLAREQLKAQHPLDGDACFALGQINQARKEAKIAISFYQEVLTSHVDARVAPMALLGRGVCRILDSQDDAGLSDLHDVVNQINQKASRAKLKPEALVALRQAAGTLGAHQNFLGALEVLAYEQMLDPQPGPAFYARLSSVYERRAEQVEATIERASAAEQAKRRQQVRDLRSKSGDASIAYSRALTLSDDKGYADALWKGVDLYDRAGDVQRVIASLEVFIAERPEDSLTPDALLRLGRAYQAAGLFDKAISAYQRNQFRYPQSLAASKSAVPLAQAYIAKGPDSFGKAESVLASVFENRALTPEAEEFRQALFELAQLYYRTGRYEDAVARLEEFTQRYPKEERIGQLTFLMADSYRKSATKLEVQLASADSSEGAGHVLDANEAASARKDRVTKAKGLYEKTIEWYHATPPVRDIDKLYQKLAYFYRADCLYDLGSFEEAIRLYDAAAFRYQDDPSALAAYVQIVNSYCALGKVDEAKTANERAKWLLRRMPRDAFENGGFTMPREYWEQWLKWTSQSGMWKEEASAATQPSTQPAGKVQ